MQPVHFLRRQRGISLIGLIFVIAVLAMVALLMGKILPTYSEYSSIKNAIATAKSSTNGSVLEVQNSFSKAAEISDIKSIKASDLVISRETGEVEISFEYQKQIPLFANVSLLIDYSGTTAKNGVVAEKTASAP